MYTYLLLFTLLIVSISGSKQSYDIDEYDPEDVFAYGHNLCCKGYNKKRACKKSKDYNCVWLNPNNPEYSIDQKIVRRYGSNCLGTKFVKCKRTDINADCFNGEAATPEPCVYNDPFTMDDAVCVYQEDDDEERKGSTSMLSHEIETIIKGDGDYYESNLNLIGGVAGIILLSGLGFICYKRCKQNDGKGKYINIGEYGTV